MDLTWLILLHTPSAVDTTDEEDNIDVLIDVIDEIDWFEPYRWHDGRVINAVSDNEA